MMCKQHDIPLRLVCDEYVCGMCYAELIEEEKIWVKNQDYTIIAHQGGDGHLILKAYRRGVEIKE